jgi:DNA polymerase
LRDACREPIPGDGNFSSKILIIWEAPGKEEDKVGRPFVWRSGKLLTKILEDLGYIRDKDYYITNIVKCRPPDNRDPKPEEIKTCCPYLWKQISMMRPKLIVTLGRFSFNFLVPDVTIWEWHWNFYEIDEIQGQKLDFTTKVLAIYHPAVALYNPSKKELIKDDLAKIITILPKK